MSTPTVRTDIYHITHVNNLASVVNAGGLVSDARRVATGMSLTAIGMSQIKTRRLTLPVRCHAGLMVGGCVPFYFCPRSLMLYVIHCANADELSYRGGQEDIVHLVADAAEVARWADETGYRWAFSLSNAGAGYAEFRSDLRDLRDVDWTAVQSTNFGRGATTPSGRPVKEGKQAEFLVEEFFPWTLVRRIGVRTAHVATRAQQALADAAHKPPIEVLPNWYF